MSDDKYIKAKSNVMDQAAHLFSQVWLPRLLSEFASADSPPEELLALVLEVLLWEEFRNNRIKLVKQEIVSGAGISAQYYKLDFVLYQQESNAKVIIECDGYQFHRVNREQFSRELKRERELQRRGFRLYRFAADELFHDPWRAGFDVIDVMSHVWPEFTPVHMPTEVFSSISTRENVESEPEMGNSSNKFTPLLERPVDLPKAPPPEANIDVVLESILQTPSKKLSIHPNWEDVRKLYSRAYEPWDAEEDKWLSKRADLTLDYLSKALQRQPSAISARLNKLGHRSLK